MFRLVVLTLALLAIVTVPLSARQDDVRLDGLFDMLHSADNPIEVATVERKIWEIWTQSGSDTIDLLMSEAMRLMSRGDRESAMNQLNSVVELAPDFAEGWNKRATLHYMMGNYSDSVLDIIKTLELEPRHFGALSGLGLIYDAVENPAGALKAYERALAVHPHLRHPSNRVRELQRELKQGNI